MSDKVPNGWKECKLGEVIELLYGKGLREQDRKTGNIPVYGSNGIVGYHNEYLVKGPGIIIGRKGSVGEVKYSPVDFFPIDTTYYVSLKEEMADIRFMYYFLLTLHIDEMNSHSAVPGLNRNDVYSLDVTVPPLPEQRAIASILSSLDDKIDLLHRENKTLEAMAETLFRQWFVVEAEKRWKEIKLEKYVECVTGCSYKSIDLNPSNIALVTLKNFARDGSFRMDGFKEYTGDYKKSQIVKQGDLVVAHTDITQEGDIIGNPVLIINPGQYKTLVITMDLMKVESTAEWLSKEFLYYLFKTPDFKFHCLGCSNGTTVLHMSRNAIPSYELKIPNKEKVIAFTKRVRPIIEKKFTNISQIRTLEKLRDTLLPKLMSGEVRIQY